MPRSIWKGSVSFGLVSIGVKLYSATEEKDVSFHQVRRTDGAQFHPAAVAALERVHARGALCGLTGDAEAPAPAVA